MKLYTEKQVVYAISIAFDIEPPIKVRDILRELTPIELPSDDEIEEMGKDIIVYNDTKRGWFVEGLKFMRDEIIGGNNEQKK